ncbi:hypothetical protein [Bdellovibrio sp. HCB2-146]|uniref:hypothetical protein n=1 Tax=Bdellovibrio sp. HCB2-146 TaxID=3394362 RepID=UPI0039BCAFA4
MKFSILFLSCILAATQSFAFGTKGQDGSSGDDGRRGTDGQDIQVFAQNLTGLMTYHLNGTDAGDAEEGRDGESAYACSYFEDDENIVGADAGDGGNGGDGGRGGDGGSALIYYSDISQLKNLYISAVPGKGGYGARGGRAGRDGCRCNRRSWEVRKCSNEWVPDDRPPQYDPDGKPVPRSPIWKEVCHEEQFYCTDGRSGSNGREGSDGSRGNYGALTLVKSNSELLPEAGGGYVAINKLSAAEPTSTTLTENIFESKKGAISLLAPGSIVSDTYREFVRRAEENVQIIWASPKDPATFSGSVYVGIGNGQVSFQVMSNELLISETKDEGNMHSLIIKEAYKLADFAQVSLKKSHSGKRTQIIVTAPTPRRELVKDTYSVRIKYVRWLLPDKYVYSGAIPPELVQKGAEQTIVNLGKLQFEDSSSIWNKKLEVEFTYSRQVRGLSQGVSKTLKYTQEKL